MSDTEQREIEFVTGTIEGINQKGADKWAVEAKPAGSQYTRNLWTKDAELVRALSSRTGQSETFRCNVSHWTNQDGKPVRSLWIDGIGGSSDGTASAVAVPSGQSTSDTMSKEDWADKDRRDYRSRSWAHTISLLGPHLDKSAVDISDVVQLHSRLRLMVDLIYVDICRSHEFAHPNLGDGAQFGDDVPF
jgi:hypothetical protein